MIWDYKFDNILNPVFSVELMIAPLKSAYADVTFNTVSRKNICYLANNKFWEGRKEE